MKYCFILPGTLGSDIEGLDFDSRGNVWTGGQNGLGRTNVTTGVGEHFTQLNSGLIADKVRQVQYQRSSGKVYVATSGGISIVGPFLGTPSAETGAGYPFPNPFVIRNSTDRLNFTHAEDGVVSIFTVTGELVVEQSVNVGWDGTNQAGRKVASGVYLYIFTSVTDQQHQGKFLLVQD